MNITPAENISYCDLKEFSKSYKDYHFYLCLLVCIVGSIFNILNICVLSTKQMRCPTNLILTSLAVANVLVMMEYIPFAYLHGEQQPSHDSYYYTYTFASFILFHALFTQSFHFIACAITIILAIWRYVAVKFPQNVKSFDETRTKWAIFATYLLCPFICTPLYLSLIVRPVQLKLDAANKKIPESSNLTSYRNFTVYVVAYEKNVFKPISLYVYAIVIKLIPCLFLTVLSSLLIVELLKAKERRKKLMKPSKFDDKVKRNHRCLEKEKQADRTTRMLLAVLLLFLMVEFPQAIFGLLNHIIGQKFEQECYQPLGDLLDIFTLINSAINFVLYCIMSQKFRQVFKELFFPYIPFVGKHTADEWISLQTVNTLV